MDTVNPRTVYALVLTFEEKNEVKQEVMLWSLKGNANSFRRNLLKAIQGRDGARLIAETLEQFDVVPVLGDEPLQLAAHSVAVTWEGEAGTVEQSIELFERGEDAESARERHERSFEEGESARRLVALTCKKTPITAPISEGDTAFRSYMDAVDALRPA